jgi:sugar/nucleoside kinase (ribokinase family)
MTESRFDVVGIGNAIVDVLAQASDEFLEAEGLSKGAMALVGEPEALALYQRMGTKLERSGGSAGNTMAGLASLGGSGAYIGKVNSDRLGSVFGGDLREGGIVFDTPPLTAGPSTAQCLILVTPDAQRTMSTYLGACVELTQNDVDPQVIKDSQVTYLEGYLFDRPSAKAAFRKAAELAHAAGRKVSLSLSDAFCVERHRAEFLELVQNHVDVLFANEREILALYQRSSFEQAAVAVRAHCEVAVLTRSEKGAIIVANGDSATVAAEPVSQVVDTTGAGDLYASGFLYGYTRSRPLRECARLGALAAAEVIGHFGARPETRLADWIKGRL